jgi:RNA ligase (TIGR02306 family)
MRKLASIQRIKDVQPIEGADRVEVVSILGWKVVTRKNEFKVGDLCVYFEIDSILPRNPWNDFLADKNKPDKPFRVRTARIRGQISQGLAFPLKTIFNDSVINSLNEGTDVTEIIGVEKYEPQIPAQLSSDVKGTFPSIVPKTDETRIQAEPNLLEECAGIPMYWALKVDGTSATFVNVDGEHHVCSRNLSLKEKEGNTYWEMYHKYNLKKVLDENPDYAIQGEIAGPGIQKNTMGLEEHTLFVFNVYDVKEGKIISYAGMNDFCKYYGLKTVPIAMVNEYINTTDTVEDLVEFANKAKYPNGKPAEGYVIRPMIPQYSKVLNSRMSFKIINNKYLLKNE